MDKLKIENGKLKDEDKKYIYIKFVLNFQLSTLNFQLTNGRRSVLCKSAIFNFHLSILNYKEQRLYIMNNEKVYLSEEGYKKLDEKLRHLINEEQPAVVKRLAEAREHGDLSENAEYHAAKDELARISGEIAEIQAELKLAVIYSAEKTGAVSIGTKVTVKDESGAEDEYEIVGTAEADIYSNKISNESAVGAALIGARAGETVTVQAPGGHYTLTVIKIN